MLLLGLRQGTWSPEAYHGALPADVARFMESKFYMPKKAVVVALGQLLKFCAADGTPGKMRLDQPALGEAQLVVHVRAQKRLHLLAVHDPISSSVANSGKDPCFSSIRRSVRSARLILDFTVPRGSVST